MSQVQCQCHNEVTQRASLKYNFDQWTNGLTVLSKIAEKYLMYGEGQINWRVYANPDV